jgi:hypothetical protein
LFYRKVYGNEKYIFNPSEKAQCQIKKFIELIDERYKLETVGINFLISYFVFQFDYWTKCEIKEKTNWSDKIQLSYIIGGKAFVRYDTRDVKFDWTISQSDFLKKYNVSTQSIKDFFIQYDETSLNQVEENNKKKFYNTERHFLNCIENTSLYNHRSQLCIVCKNKVDCKVMLKSNYENIYVARGY